MTVPSDAILAWGALGAWTGMLLVWERVAPAVMLPRTRAWHARVAANLALTMGVATLGEFAWLPWLRDHVGAGLFHVEQPWAQGALGYLLGSGIFYAWHRARHEVRALWDLLHQMHHAPARIEAVTAYYVHPLEAVPSSIVNALVVYGLLGGDADGLRWSIVLFSAVGLFYHSNVRTPRALDLFVATPELHRLHHRRGHHRWNYGDLPVWDRLFGTYRSRDEAPEGFAMGFRDDLEDRYADILRARNVLERTASPRPGAG